MRTSFTFILAAVLGVSAAFAKQDQPTVSSGDATITYGSGFSPSYNGGAGSGNWQFCIGGYTNFTLADNGPEGTWLTNGQWTSSWNPDNAGGYSFWIGKCGDADWNMSNIPGPYSLTVNRASQPDVWSDNVTITDGDSFTPPFHGGADGAGNWQFCIGGYTNWNMADNGPGGTQLPNGQWAGSWTPPGPGTYGVYIGKCGNNNYLSSNYAGWYTLTVTARPPVPQTSDVLISPSSITVFVGESVTFTASGGSGSGDYQWSDDASGTGSSNTVTFNSDGTHHVSVKRGGDSNYLDSNTATATIEVHKRSQSISISPSSQTINVGDSITFSASGGSGGGSYIWSGDASGSGSSMSIIFNTPGPHSVTVYHQGDAAYNDSDPVSAAITVNEATHSLNVVNGTGSASGLTQGSQVTITANAPPGGQMFNGWSVSGPGTIGNAGSASTTFTMGAGDATVTATYCAIPQSPPVITSAANAPGTVGTAFNYYITATNNPTSYAASGLPSGLSVNASTGLISGTPTTAGSYNATIYASNGGGTGQATLAITISATATRYNLNVHLPVAP